MTQVSNWKMIVKSKLNAHWVRMIHNISLKLRFTGLENRVMTNYRWKIQSKFHLLLLVYKRYLKTKFLFPSIFTLDSTDQRFPFLPELMVFWMRICIFVSFFFFLPYYSIKFLRILTALLASRRKIGFFFSGNRPMNEKSHPVHDMCLSVIIPIIYQLINSKRNFNDHSCIKTTGDIWFYLPRWGA